MERTWIKESLFNIEKRVWRCWGGGSWNCVWVTCGGGLWKIGEVKWEGVKSGYRTSRGCSLCRDLGTLVKRNKNQLLQLYDNQANLASWDPSTVMPGTQSEIFQVIQLAGQPGEWTKRKTGQRVTHFLMHIASNLYIKMATTAGPCHLIPGSAGSARLMWLGPYYKLYCHAVRTRKLWNLPFSRENTN